MSVWQGITGIMSQRAGENKPPAVKFTEARTRRPVVVAGSSCGPFLGFQGRDLFGLALHVAPLHKYHSYVRWRTDLSAMAQIQSLIVPIAK
jgi:hypothetical protein